MFRLPARDLFAVATLPLLPFTLHASFQLQDLALADVQDPTIHAELCEFGAYQELNMAFMEETMLSLPLRSWSPGHVEFCGEGVRVRIESQRFDHAKWIKKSRGAFLLEGTPILGWTQGEEHSRMSRVELVIDGAVVDIPVSAYLDLFDAPLTAEDGSVLFANVRRSRDGWRTYVHAQVGEGHEARIVTWVAEYGAYLYRVVDRLE